MKNEKPPVKRYETLVDFVVSEARAAWILERYPPSDIGRPGILVVSNKRSKSAELEESGELEAEEGDSED
jgi:hypothetical protein